MKSPLNVPFVILVLLKNVLSLDMNEKNMAVDFNHLEIRGIKDILFNFYRQQLNLVQVNIVAHFVPE